MSYGFETTTDEAYAEDPVRADALWDLSEQMVGLR